MKYILFFITLVLFILSCGVESSIRGDSPRAVVLPCSVVNGGNGLMVICPDGTQALIPPETSNNSMHDIVDTERELDTESEEEATSPLSILVCHKPGTPAEKSMNIPLNALQGHLAHGDYIGDCDNG